MKFNTTLLALAVTALSLAACEDPTKGKAKATTGEAIPSATTQAATAASGSAPTAASGSAPTAAGAARFAFDQAGSKVGWVGSKVTGKHEGGFGTFKGTIDVTDGAAEKSKVSVEIDADSLTSDQEKLTGHLKSPDFFDTKAHPKATFASTEIKKGGDKGATHTVTGNLTIKGITKSISFPATVSVTGDAASLDAEFSINRRDFSLNYAGKPNDLIRDDVLIKLTIRAKKG
jgi:polyisoprenoid-binding protein YceI